MKNITKNNKQNKLISKIKKFFSTKGWVPLPYQIESCEAFLLGAGHRLGDCEWMVTNNENIEYGN